MEAASLPRGGTGPLQSIAEAARSRSRAFWIVAGLTLGAALLRFVTLGDQSYHHDEVVTASRVLDGSFGHAMDAVGYSESTPPLYYALAWVWTQATGTGEWGLRSLSALAGVLTVPVAYLVAAELRGRRAGLWAAALVAFNPMLLWYSQEARAYALLVLFAALSLLWCIRAGRSGRRRDFLWWGLWSGLALATHYFAIFPLVAELVYLLRRRGRATLGGVGIVAAFSLALLPLAYEQMSSGRAEWIGGLSLGHRLWESAGTFVTGETAAIIGEAERPGLAIFPLAMCAAAFALLLWRGGREERRAAALPFAVGACAIVIPVAVAIVSPSKDYVLARNLIPALVPLLVVVAIALSLPEARRLGAIVGTALLVYSLGFCLAASTAPSLQRPDWSAVAADLGEPTGPRAIVSWTLGEAPLRYYLSTEAFQARASEGNPWFVHEVDFISDGEAPPPPPELLGPRFRERGAYGAGRLFVRRYSLPGPSLARIDLRKLRRANLEFRTTGVLLDGIGPS
ncbi:MAG: glycosyltransferase family 39 protein [Actinobacteria bacterium]|nr:glycosyltransferase family 39 protein [Actinomycetota bacterium]